MATVTSLTAARMLAIEASSVVSGEVVGDELILTKHDGSTIDAGNVRGPQGYSNGVAGGDLTGNFPNPTIASGVVTDAKVASANKDGTAATPSMRTLGTGAQQAVAGNDSRLSDSRAPNGSAGGELSGTYPNPALADTGWVNLTTANCTAGTIAYRIKGGVVSIRIDGLVFTSLAAGSNLSVTAAAALPAEARPSADLFGAVFSSNAVGYARIYAGGTIAVHASTAAMTGASGIIGYHPG